MRRISILLIIVFIGLLAQAQEVIRPVTSAYMVEAGSSHITSTYLSPLSQAGWQTSFSYSRMQAMRFNPERWTMQLEGRFLMGRVSPRWRNAPIWDMDLNLGWSMLWRYNLNSSWRVMAGGYTDVNLGVLYAPRNSNNPISGKASWTLGPRGAIQWQGALGRIPLTVRYQVDMPLTGIFFAPDYGELYYEIYLGNHSGLVHAAWPGNFFRLRNLLTADFRFGSTTVRLGYRCNIESSKVNNLINNAVSHTAVVGIVSEWISLAPGRRIKPDAKIVY